MEREDDPCGIREWVVLPMPRRPGVRSVSDMDLAVLAGVLSTGLFAMSYLPMLVKAARTRDLSSYSIGNLAITNVGNAVHSVYVFSLPLGPIWFLHTFYLVASALMLIWFYTFRAGKRAPRKAADLAVGRPRAYRDRYLTGARRAAGARDALTAEGTMTSSGVLERGLEAFGEQRWSDAFDALTEADAEVGLDGGGLERLATAAILLGRETGIDTATRAHEAFLEAGDEAAAARAAVWIGMHLMDMGEVARSAGWLARAGRIVASSGGAESVGGLLLIPQALGALYGGDLSSALHAFDEALTIGERFHDRDTIALARLGLGQVKIMLGDVESGFALFDEVMVAVTAGEISPVPSGIAYCEVIGALSARLRLPPSQGMDHRARPLVRRPARHGPVQCAMPDASRGALPPARRVAGRARGGADGPRAGAAGRPERVLGRVVPAGRGTAPSRGGRRGGGVVPPRGRDRIRPRAGSRPASTGAGQGTACTVAHSRGGGPSRPRSLVDGCCPR